MCVPVNYSYVGLHSARRVVLFADVPRFDIPWLPNRILAFVSFFIAPYLVGLIHSVQKEQTKGLAAVGITSDWRLYAVNSLWDYSAPRILVAILLVRRISAHADDAIFIRLILYPVSSA